MAKPGDVVEFRSGLFGIDPPRNLAILLDRQRRKGVVTARLLTLDGEKECKWDNLTRRAFKARFEGRLNTPAERSEALGRLRHFVEQHSGGNLAEHAEDDLAALEERLWEKTAPEAEGQGQESWTEEEIARAGYGPTPSPQQLRDVREALDRCRRAGTGRFQTVGGRGDVWRPWRRDEARRMREAAAALQALRQRLVAVEETPEGERSFARIELDAAGLTDDDRETLQWAKAAMVQFVEHDGVPDGGEPVAGWGRLGAVRAFGLDLHRNLGFLAQDWIRSGHTTHSSDYVHFLLETGLWSADDAVDGLIRRHVNQEPFFEHSPDEAAEAAADVLPEPRLEDDPHRTDLRHLACHTIDPPDARDFDDAVGIEAGPAASRVAGLPDVAAGTVRLWVHIADVGHYVRADTLLDRHARKRATSVYLPGRVLPMLPKRISDHLCSLRDDGDRFALSVAMDIGADGRASATAFFRSIIRVTKNMNYGQALEAARRGQQPFADYLALSQRMREHRRGLELETGELKVILEQSGFSALEKRADDATRMIETFMVAANEAVAKHLDQTKVPQLFRCHPLPDATKAGRAERQLRTMGFDVRLDLPRRAAEVFGGSRAGGVRGRRGGAGGSAATAPSAPKVDSILERLKSGGGKLQLFGGGVQFAGGDEDDDGPDDAATRRADGSPKAAAAGSAQTAADGASATPTGSAAGKDAEDAPETLDFAALSAVEQDAWLAPFRRTVGALAGHDDRDLAEVGTLKLLAALGRAYYSPQNTGHFGLGLVHYSHFTSPIRRYPDLVSHRNLAWLLAPENGRSKDPPHTWESLKALCDHCSDQERAADSLERRIKASCLVLASLHGETAFSQSAARITGLSPGGVFVAMSEGLEARVPSRDLPGGPYEVDEWEAMLLLPERHGEGSGVGGIGGTIAAGRSGGIPPSAQAATRTGEPIGPGTSGALPEMPRSMGGRYRVWTDADLGETRLVRAVLGDPVTVQLAGRDVAAGRTEARLAAWRGETPS